MTSSPAKEAGLLPCPFCGGRVIQEDSTECRDAEDYFWFSCQTCGCETEGEHGRDRAIAAWNTRAPSPSPDQPAGEDKDALIRELTARAEAAEGLVVEMRAIEMFRQRWPDKPWLGPDVSRSYWRRRAKAALATEAKDGRAG